MERQGDVTAQLYFLQPGPWPGTHFSFQHSSTQILSSIQKTEDQTETMKSEQGF